ncbi:DUF6415 family natural product biosynthesis protein [Streptomyces sp. NBC_00715]|uniref:DUF6415 family natural product biosynthesis protein n=1 Tax=Streptomyces sp. NBC_00715 TaxID=2975811 RepID=UPI0038646750
MQSTARPPSGEDCDDCPPDIATMRSSARRFLTEDAFLPSSLELETLMLQLRGHMQLLIPDVEQLIARLPHDDVPRYCALACVGEARRKLGIARHFGLDAGIAHARRLARSLNALCDHYENFSDVRS